MITVELDPRLILPPVTGVDYGQTDLESIPTPDDAEITEVSLSELEEINPPFETGGLMPPENVVILSQSARMSDTGQIVVDVLLDIMDMPGAVEYEIRMAVG